MTNKAFSHNGVDIHIAAHLSDLTEGLEWCTNTQGSLTHHDNVLEGIRIGSSESSADIINGHNVCTFLCRDKQGDGHKANTSDTFTSWLKMSLDAMRDRERVGVVVEGKHRSLVAAGIILPEPEQFAVAGAFVVTDVWFDWVVSEQGQSADRVLMARLELCDGQGIWWNSSTAAASSQEIGTSTEFCSSCERPLARRYKEGDVFCGHPECPTRLDPAQSTGLSIKTRDYAPEYLARRTPLPAQYSRSFNLVPPAPAAPTVDQLKAWFADKDNNHPGWKSWNCSNCKRFNCRME
ncbi:uncharacterized protein AB675_1406 [Cyphellophora attinorum]|uniref:Uncharacterized protein n=1 Tax=Cyphellophora attinorum TaxID=1664694 RepID=A0A0N0NHN0_9EURO|nr:uncharacterized protein AB675_1406 [Phialophora attinorum]KPI34459.1 hypothetical protein AB675_1406 [Phialophora attinorum]